MLPAGGGSEATQIFSYLFVLQFIVNPPQTIAASTPGLLVDIVLSLKESEVVELGGEEVVVVVRGVQCRPHLSNVAEDGPTRRTDEVLAVLGGLPDGSKYRLVGGNTGTGKYVLF